MKKTTITLGLSVLLFAANAQQTLKIKNPLKGGKRFAATENSNKARLNGNNSVSQIGGSISCNTLYAAGTTMDLKFTFNLTTDSAFEFSDSLAITFPAGITPNSSPQTVFPAGSYNSGAFDLAGGQVPDTLNTISGQTISWGKNDNGQYGGIETGAGPITFTVNVTIGAGVTGNQTANFYASTDTYDAYPAAATAGSFSGSFIIYSVGTVIVDMATTFVQPKNLTKTANCNYGSDTIVAQIKNLGNTTQTNVMVMGSVNGGTAMMGTVLTQTLAPGDSSYVIWLPAYDFSATNTYKLKAWTAQAGDVSTANDTATLTFANHQSVNLSTTTYTNGIETAQNVADLSLQGNAASFTGLSATVHSGSQALFTTVATTNPAGTYTVIISLPCMDVTAGETYRISYWRRTNSTSGGNGQSGVYTGLSTSSLSILKPYSANTLNTWTKDSVDFVATTTETRYFAISGTGSVTASTQMNCRFDDINIAKLPAAGIKTLVNNADLSMYPNPTTGLLNITTAAAKATVEIYNMMGQNVATKEITNGNNTIDISNLSNGVYSIQITQNNTVTVGKVIKTN